MNSRGHPLWTSISSLTDEELAMLRDLGNDEDIATSQYLRGTCPFLSKACCSRQHL